jgi:hypothetical protein
MFECWNVGMLEWGSVRMLECLNVGMLEWGFRKFRVGGGREKRYPFHLTPSETAAFSHRICCVINLRQISMSVDLWIVFQEYGIIET